MEKFNPKIFLAVLKEEAEKEGIEFRLFFMAMRVNLNCNRLDKMKCLRLLQLVGTTISFSEITLEHIPSCWFCATLVKCAWMKSTTEEDREEIFEYVMKVNNISPEHFEAKLLDDSAEEAGDPHLSYGEMICFNSISQNRRNHRALCKQCDLIMLIFETMPLPDLC